MADYDSNKILAFSHIPKTAGTSFNYLLRRYFGRRIMAVRFREGQESTFQYQNFLEDSKLFPKLSCISGHSLKPFINFGPHEKQFSWFTFFRDPEKRFVSHYIHQQTNQDPKYKMDMIEWAETYNRSNLQVQWLAGKQDLAAAIQILDEKFPVIGITSEFSRSVDQLVQFNRLKKFSKSLTNKKMVVRSEEIRKNIRDNYSKYQSTIKHCNSLDQQLFEYALKKFSVQLQNLGEQPQSNFSVKSSGPFKPLSHWLNLLFFQFQDKIVYARSLN
ncbi:sulfotransferase family protein [Mariniblastus sp.]|nr:sulfotransferase family protein [Mariniblastus sp.]